MRYDEDAPVPRIDSISVRGEVTVLFSKSMQTRAVLTQGEIYGPSQRLLTAENDHSVKGRSSPNFKNFTLLHNSTLVINGTVFPSVLVAIKPDDPDDICV